MRRVRRAPDRLRQEAFLPPRAPEITQAFTRVEDIAYVGLGILLAASAVVLLLDGALMFGRRLVAGTLPGRIVEPLDRILFILMTVGARARARTLPHRWVDRGYASHPRGDRGVRRGRQDRECLATRPVLELGLLTLMVLILVIALVLLRRRSAFATADRA